MKETTNKDLRQFGIVLSAILGVFGLVHFLKGHAGAYPWFWGTGAVSLALSLFVPRAMRPVYIAFTKIAHAIGWFNTRVILTLIYYVILTPIALIMRLLRKDPLHRRLARDLTSYWIERASVTAAKESLEKQF
jgi:hypothetical protein